MAGKIEMAKRMVWEIDVQCGACGNTGAWSSNNDTGYRVLFDEAELTGWLIEPHRKRDDEVLCPDCAKKQAEAKANREDDIAIAKKQFEAAKAKLKQAREPTGPPPCREAEE